VDLDDFQDVTHDRPPRIAHPLVRSTWSERLAWEACCQDIVVWHPIHIFAYLADIVEDELWIEIVEQDLQSDTIELTAGNMIEIDVVVLECLDEAFNSTAESKHSWALDIHKLQRPRNTGPELIIRRTQPVELSDSFSILAGHLMRSNGSRKRL
jgi:hypothetical protein